MEIFKRKTLSERLKGEAVSLGLCHQWQCEWKDDSSADELALKYVRGLDFCFKHDWPSAGFIKEHFGVAFRRRWGIYVDETATLSPHSVPKTVVVLGRSDVKIECEDFEVKTVYARHQGNVVVEARGHSKVYVSIYDDVQLTCLADDDARIFVYRYGGIVDYVGSVLIRDRTWIKS